LFGFTSVFVFFINPFIFLLLHSNQKEKEMKTCGLDVHKDSVFCAIYNGKCYSEVKEYETTTPKIRQMGEYLRSEGVKKVSMESTSTY
jgi:hypothetical protein